MRTLSILLILSLCRFLPAQEERADALVSPRKARQVITVGGPAADIQGFNNRSVQYAIDALEETGGTVVLQPGSYEIVSPVRLRSNVELKGSGATTILKRADGVQTRFIADADFGELKLTVEDPGGFGIGMKVQVTDSDNNSCWNVSAATITDIVDHVLYIDKGLIRDYQSDRNGLVSNASSVIEITDAENVTVSGLVIDGNRESNYFADGCNSAGVLILRSKWITVDNVVVKDFNGEGISWQITEYVTVKNSEIAGSGNTGLHPGTGSPFTLIENNDIHHNERDGLFICWRVYQGMVTGNRIHHNGRYGICTGHKDTDVVFENNHIFSNGSDGVNLRVERESNAPHRNTFLRNTIGENGTGGGGYGFSVESPAMDLVLRENLFSNATGSQKAAIYVYGSGSKPLLENNRFDHHELGEMAFEREYLFNGKDLEGWIIYVEDPAIEPGEFFYVTGDVIETPGIPNGYLRSVKQYSDYHLHVEWRYPDNPTNSGIFVHTGGPDLFWPAHYQGQLKHLNAGDFIVHGIGEKATLRDTTYTSTEQVKPVVPKIHPANENPAGEWNSYDIYCTGNTVEMKVNGLLQNRATGCSLTRGSIGLQAEGSRIQFRNLWIEPISNLAE